jgi:hypothetical protein
LTGGRDLPFRSAGGGFLRLAPDRFSPVPEPSVFEWRGFGTRSFFSQTGQRTIAPMRCTGTLKTRLQVGHLIFSGICW